MNNKRPLLPVRKRSNRLSGAVRKPVAGAIRPESRLKAVWRRLTPSWTLPTLPTLPLRHKRALLLGGAGLVVAGGIGALVMMRTSEPSVASSRPTSAALSWQSCLSQWPDGTLYPDLLPVPAGEYRLHANSQELKPFLAPHGLNRIQIKEPFLIEKHEVTLKAFRRYVAVVDKMSAGADKDRLKAHIGLHWNKDESETAPVKGISWEAAWDYTDWLGRETGCAYGLPSREQWGASVLLLDGGRENASKAGILSGESLKRLLWGVREWTVTPCAGGYYLVGEDDFVPLPEVRSATCMPAMLSVAGFRVVLKAAASQDPKTAKTAPVAAKP
ncbi:MAG: SUMF1/EgtB/PvdO family nonheme iron enzyme [Magnetococcales bacterium]|nr:SUMF1/EgtB/PvdO family nonheme iron enzyme [Magnetococcales bacterium]